MPRFPRLNRRIGLDKLKRAYKLLGTSWNVQTGLFFDHSTLHGVRYIAERGRPFIERFMWFVCVALGAVATMIIIVSLWEKFQTNPTITGLDTDFHSWDVPFPAVTVCQNVPSNMSIVEDFIQRKMSGSDSVEGLKTFLLKLTQFSYETLPELKQYFDKGYVPEDTNLKDFVFQLMSPCESMLTGCDFKSESYNCCDGFFPVFTENGFCYTFNSRHYEKTLPGRAELLPPFEMKYIKETDIKWSLKFDISGNNGDLKVPIYIHNSDEVPGIDVRPQHIWSFDVDKISFSVKQTYTTEDARQLSIKQRHCAFGDEIKLTVDQIYTYTACTRQCRMETATRKCKCVPYFYPEIGKYRHCTVKEMGCIVDNIGSIMSVDHCSCQLSCSNTVYEVEKLNENSDANSLEAEFVSWPMVRYKREVLFGWVDLLVSFGGIAGLFLGFSLLSGVEFVYYFTIRARCMVHMEAERLTQIQLQERTKRKPEYDLSLVPYFMSRPLPGHGVNELVKGYYRENVHNFSNRITPESFGKSGNGLVAPFGIEFVN